MITRRTALKGTALAAALTQAAAPALAAADKVHRIAMHVDDNDQARMNLALNNAANAIELYSQRGEATEIEIVTYGPGLHMLREDTSPVKERLKAFMQKEKKVAFAACANTMAGMKRSEGKDVPLIEGAKIVPAGVVRLVELQEEGWSYLRP